MDRLRNTPVIGPVIGLIDRWPRLSAWIVLSVGCIALLVYEARDVGLTAANWIALIVATIGVAGLCIWIVAGKTAKIWISRSRRTSATRWRSSVPLSRLSRPLV